MQLIIYYYFLISFHYHLALHLTDSSISSNLLYDFDAIGNNQLSNEYCHNLITYTQIFVLVSTNRCPSIKIKNDISSDKNRSKRSVNGGSIDIKALQTTINNNRIMIEYLFNNTINQTILAEALYNHSRKAPPFSNWRDLVDLLCIISISIVLIYVFLCRIGLAPCDKMLEYLFRPIIRRLENKKYNQHHHLQQQRKTVSSPPTTISEHIKKLDKIAESTQQNSLFTFNGFQVNHKSLFSYS